MRLIVVENMPFREHFSLFFLLYKVNYRYLVLEVTVLTLCPSTAKVRFIWAVIFAKLVEWSLPIPEVRSLNPVISKLLYRTVVCCQLYWKDKKEAGNGPFLKSEVYSLIFVHCLKNICQAWLLGWAGSYTTWCFITELLASKDRTKVYSRQSFRQKCYCNK